MTTGTAAPPLLDPLTIRGVTLRNRIAVSPMCQYSSVDGEANDWHVVHLGSRAVGGAGLVFTEASAVTADGPHLAAGPRHLEGRADSGTLFAGEDHQGEMARYPAYSWRTRGGRPACPRPWGGGQQLGLDAGGWPSRGPERRALPARRSGTRRR